MGRLLRLDRTGHTTLAEWTPAGGPDFDAAAEAFHAELERGYFGIATTAGGGAQQVRTLPLDAPTVILRKPIAGG